MSDLELRVSSSLNVASNNSVPEAKRTGGTDGAERQPLQKEKMEEERSYQAKMLASLATENGNLDGIDMSGSYLSFTVDNDTGDVVITVIDSETDEVIRKIPPDKVLNLKEKMGYIHGLLIDRKV